MSHATARRLVARTRRIDQDGPLDLVAAAGEGGTVWDPPAGSDRPRLAARGTAARLVVPVGADLAVVAAQVEELLAGIEEIEEEDGREDDGPRHHRPGRGPLAIAALPFSSDSAGLVTVPAEVIGVGADGVAWRTTIGAPATAAPRLRDSHPRPGSFGITAIPDHPTWLAQARRAVRLIEDKDLDKVVLARSVEVEADGELATRDALRVLRSGHPMATTFFVDGFLGASPELILSRRGYEVRSEPMAGTVSGGAGAVRGLLDSPKERNEHGLVVQAVSAALASVCRDIEVPSVPGLFCSGDLVHLATPIRGRLRPEGGRLRSALALVALLHPTPAVAGSPTSAALELIRHLEPGARGRYAGPVGWMDARGDGDWVLGIRSAEVSGRRARLWAGAGLVAGSDPESELAETQLKLQVLLGALVRP